MPTLFYGDHEIPLEAGQTVLKALLSRRLYVPYQCQVGACQTCLLRALEGTPPAPSQAGLTPREIEHGFFLSCVAVPDSDLRVKPL